MNSARQADQPWRQCLVLLLLAALAGAPALFGQSSRSAAVPTSPRALALLELAPDGRARLVPIAIRIENKFYDAGLYHATPRPMAVDPQTVYEVLRSGEPLGLFTVTRAQTLRDVWIGLGQWRPQTMPATAKKPAPERRPLSGSLQAGPISTDADDRPVLRRRGSSPPPASGDTDTAQTTAKPAESTADSSRPTLKRPASSDSTAEAGDDRPTLKRPADQSAPAEEDPDRPTLKRPASSDSTAANDDPSRPALKRPARGEDQTANVNDDPDRPTLRRGKPTDRQSADETPPLVTERPGTATATAANEPQGKLEVLAAISDAKGKDSHSLLLSVNPAERQQIESKVQALAYAAVVKWVAAHPAVKAAPAGLMRVTAFQVFNLQYNDEPVAVYAAALPAAAPAPPVRRGAAAPAAPVAAVDPAFRFYVTIVTRTDMYGELHTLLAQVTDSRHLDAYARLELIDAVDAEGTGTGQLLFRRVGDRSFTYGIYRVGMDRCWAIFESAEKGM
jgi:hypothetical protein